MIGLTNKENDMKMKLPEGSTGFGVGGVELEVHDGVVNVPEQYVQAARDHGLTPYNEEAQAQVPAPQGTKNKGGKGKDTPPTFKVGDKVSVIFEGDKDATVGEIIGFEDSEAVVKSEQLDDPFKLDVKFLTLVKE
jgi:hypothetical protein